ncbi:MAG: HAD hydrolase-like protein, partial [Puniceicoccaceae bacterium]
MNPPEPIQAVIFDLDGVIVSTDDCHARAWQRLAGEEKIPVTPAQLERCRGVSRMESLDIVLEQSPRDYTPEEKHALAERKNRYYRDSLAHLGPDDLLPGIRPLLDDLRTAGIRQAIGSSSRNTPFILKQIGLEDFFDAVADGNDITRSKPDP